MSKKTWQCDDCDGAGETLAATTTVRWSDAEQQWVITGDIEIDWCDGCESEKPRATMIDLPEAQA